MNKSLNTPTPLSTEDTKGYREENTSEMQQFYWRIDMIKGLINELRKKFLTGEWFLCAEVGPGLKPKDKILICPIDIGWKKLSERSEYPLQCTVIDFTCKTLVVLHSNDGDEKKQEWSSNSVYIRCNGDCP